MKASDDAGIGNCQLRRISAETVIDVRCSGMGDDIAVQGCKTLPVQSLRSLVSRPADGVGKILKYGHGCRNRSKPAEECARRCKAGPALVV